MTWAVLSVVLMIGVGWTIRGLAGEAGPLRPAESADLRQRRRNQLIFGALDVTVAVALLYFFNIFALAFGGLGGLIGFALAIPVILTAVASALDQHMGPLPSTTRDSRRRGAAAALAITGVGLVFTTLTSDRPIFHLSAAPVAGLTYAVTTGLQWSRVNARQVRCSG